MSDVYRSLGGGGKLKLKGVKDAKIDKKKKKSSKLKPVSDGGDAANTENTKDVFQDNSVVLKSLAEEDAAITKDDHRQVGIIDGEEQVPGSGTSGQEKRYMKTEAERKHEEQRRKRLEDRLKKEGVKSHKQRVEELNKYLSGLSEHHDMPKIGPG